jgi:hypothetical protein
MANLCPEPRKLSKEESRLLPCSTEKYHVVVAYYNQHFNKIVIVPETYRTKEEFEFALHESDKKWVVKEPASDFEFLYVKLLYRNYPEVTA